MSSPPSSHAVEVLLALSESSHHRHGWIQMDYTRLADRLQMGAGRVRELVSELIAGGQCIPAAHGDLVYLTVEGVVLAEAARQPIRSGTVSVSPAPGQTVPAAVPS
jgi:hypothetical protein